MKKAAESMKLSELIVRDAIVPDLRATDKRSAIRELVDLVRTVHKPNGFKAPEITEGLLKREKVGSTGIGSGVAVPHEKFAELERFYGAFGRSVKGIDYKSVDGEPVHLVFLLLSPAGDPDAHVQALQLITLAVRSANFSKFLRRARDGKEIHELFQEIDQSRQP